MKKFELNNVEYDFLNNDNDENVEEHSKLHKFKLLIADDDEDIHKVTRIILSDFSFENSELEIISSYSGEQTREVLRTNPDIAVILLDIVMESEQEGLEVVKYLRDVLKNKYPRIILRTGQPGVAPEDKIIAEYDVHDYKNKTELTAQKLFTVMYSSLRSYRDLRALEKHKIGLEKIIHASKDLYGYYSIQDLLAGILIQLTSFNLDETTYFISSDNNSRNDGFITSDYNSSDSKIVAATGIYKEYVGKSVNEIIQIISIEGFDNILNTIKNEIRIRDDFYIGHHLGVNGNNTYIFLQSSKEYIDEELLNLFLVNFSSALDNYYINNEIIETQYNIIYSLGAVIEGKSGAMANHVRRVSEIAILIARELDFSADEIKKLHIASAIHDIGKIGITDKILLKSDKLTQEEFDSIKKHTIIGEEILKDSNLSVTSYAKNIVRYHHERWDGGGYPDNLSGEQIPLEARIVAIADVFDALSHDRCYKVAWPVDDCFSFIESNRGLAFDPMVVDAFMKKRDDIVSILTEYSNE